MITPVETPEQIETTAQLARTVWREHYIPIVGEAQVEYMIARFQSPDAITRQINRDGMRYYLIGDAQGYLAFEPQGDALFLSKLYVLGKDRGKGLGREGFDFVIEQAKAGGHSRIELTVNRGNVIAIAAYESFGMKRTGERVTEIGGDFVMDDFVYELEVA